MIDIKIGTWEERGADARAIREQVFICEQGIPPQLEWDVEDHSGTHAVAYDCLGIAVATGRLIVYQPGVGRIGRMAVRRSLRGNGIGRAVLAALLQEARARGFSEIVLHAQTSAAPFYSRAGFFTRGAVFEEAGIEHIEMACLL